jgi:hypothetical protein
MMKEQKEKVGFPEEGRLDGCHSGFLKPQVSS